MRLLIAKLGSTTVQSVSVSFSSGRDVADVATDLESCIKLLRAGAYDLVLMITGAQRPRARDAIARLRQAVARLPIIVLTEPSPRHPGLAAGAIASGRRDWHRDLGLSVPADAAVAAPTRPAVELDASAQTLRAGELTISLSHAEGRLFARLWEERGRIVAAEDLLNAIYADAVRPTSRVLPVFLFKLRRKLTALGLPELIETAVGRGFIIRDDSANTIERGRRSGRQ